MSPAIFSLPCMKAIMGSSLPSDRATKSSHFIDTVASAGLSSFDTEFGDGADTKTELGASLGVGLRRGGLTIVGGLLAPDLGDSAALGASVGFDFTTF